MSIFTKQRHTEIERRLGVPKGEEWGREAGLNGGSTVAFSRW